MKTKEQNCEEIFISPIFTTLQLDYNFSTCTHIYVRVDTLQLTL
jgi:hypothetical protein